MEIYIFLFATKPSRWITNLPSKALLLNENKIPQFF
jgi:hypothetical protein